MDMKKIGLLTLGVGAIFLFVINPIEKSDTEKHGRKISLQDKWNQSLEKVKKYRASSPEEADRAPSQVRGQDGIRPMPPVNKWKFKNKEIAKRAKANNKVIKYERLTDNEDTHFKGPSGEYVFLDNIYAVKKTPDSTLIYDGADIKNGHFIVESEDPIDDAFPVVENTDTGNLGIFIGVLKLTVRDFKLLYGMVDEPNLSDRNVVFRVDEIPEIKAGYFYFSRPMEATEVYEKLFNHENVKRISLDVLEYERSSK